MARFSKKDWLDLGLVRLAKEGAAGLTVDALCSAAGRTRGSFYHHFKDHNAFLEALFLAWKQRNTLDVADAIMQQPEENRAQTLSDIANLLDQDLERAVRKFAQSNAIARQIVQDVDEVRTEFVVGLYRSAGLEETLAREIAQLEYAAYVGSQIIWPGMTAQDRIRLDQRFASMVAKAFLKD
ncbi:TetR/AcrR family transcriptional regulator [uncultured Roseibium sp.]|uniref:TetR/AcrR family transcriptional regulator n=1 Tax=uncultured Roseibium sp. TaxID=1936171 RepID=UPI002632A2D8|nr:TetR/AcrR family transcriptional regulator [uncultured Roseibium sp.]